ncbi:MAG TPA: hypothetical protein VEK08_19710 [Planctomycetota bacterium]|nr:hypothetical protein [Planctomycetota bacterium]
MAEATSGPASKNSFISYCSKCGVRVTANSAECDLLCQECASGRSPRQFHAGDSSQIPYVHKPSDEEVIEDIRENVTSGRHKKA